MNDNFTFTEESDRLFSILDYIFKDTAPSRSNANTDKVPLMYEKYKKIYNTSVETGKKTAMRFFMNTYRKTLESVVTYDDKWLDSLIIKMPAGVVPNPKEEPTTRISISAAYRYAKEYASTMLKKMGINDLDGKVNPDIVLHYNLHLSVLRIFHTLIKPNDNAEEAAKFKFTMSNYDFKVRVTTLIDMVVKMREGYIDNLKSDQTVNDVGKGSMDDLIVGAAKNIIPGLNEKELRSNMGKAKGHPTFGKVLGIFDKLRSGQVTGGQAGMMKEVMTSMKDVFNEADTMIGPQINQLEKQENDNMQNEVKTRVEKLTQLQSQEQTPEVKAQMDEEFARLNDIKDQLSAKLEQLKLNRGVSSGSGSGNAGGGGGGSGNGSGGDSGGNNNNNNNNNK